MSYAASVALQKAIYSALGANVDLQAATNGAIYDTPPPGATPDLFVTLGSESVKVASDQSANGSQHDLTISAISTGGGFSTVKAVAGLIVDILDGQDLTLERGTLVFLTFRKATARQRRGTQGRRIDLIFRARIDNI